MNFQLLHQMEYIPTLITFRQFLFMASCVPVGNIIQQENIYTFYPYEPAHSDTDQEDAVHDGFGQYQDMENNICFLQADQDRKKVSSESQFLSQIVPPSPAIAHHQASKRGGKLFNKRTRKYTGCHINLGLGHNCDYREAIGAVRESQHWDQVG